MLILAGLGNPGPKYAGHRHNVGFMAINALRDRWRFGPERARFQALASEGSIDTPGGPVRALALKPQTFINASATSLPSTGFRSRCDAARCWAFSVRTAPASRRP